MPSYYELKDQPEIRAIIKLTARQNGFFHNCDCFIHFYNTIACFILKHKKDHVKKLFQLQECTTYVLTLYSVLKGVTDTCTSIEGRVISRHWSENKPLCKKCIIYLSAVSRDFFHLFIFDVNNVNEYVDIKQKFMFDLHHRMHKTWKKCNARCYNMDVTALRVDFPYMMYYEEPVEFYLSLYFDRVRNEHGDLAFFMQEALNKTTLDTSCKCVENYLKVVVAILIDGHVDNVMGIFNPNEKFVSQMWKYYKIAQRLYNEYKKYNHGKHCCWACHESYASKCWDFFDTITNTPDLGDIFRYESLFDYLSYIWENCPVECIKNFGEPRENDDEYSLTLDQIYHHRRVFHQI